MEHTAVPVAHIVVPVAYIAVVAVAAYSCPVVVRCKDTMVVEELHRDWVLHMDLPIVVEEVLHRR